MSEQAVLENDPRDIGNSFEALVLDHSLTLPLVLDLDGTLLATDTLHEALFLLFKREWALAWRVPIWTLKGPAVVKEKLAALVTDDDVALFPCNPELQAFAEREALRGREIVLATAADRAIAEKVSKRFSFISKVIASDGRTNMSGRAKAEELRKLYPQGFIYAGDFDARHSCLAAIIGGGLRGGVLPSGRESRRRDQYRGEFPPPCPEPQWASARPAPPSMGQERSHLRSPDFGRQDDRPHRMDLRARRLLGLRPPRFGHLSAQRSLGFARRPTALVEETPAPRERRIADCLERWTYGHLRAWRARTCCCRRDGMRRDAGALSRPQPVLFVPLETRADCRRFLARLAFHDASCSWAWS